jgi:uncharacterized protein YndB with AHSA1/START domain
MTAQSPQTVRITRRFGASPERVFDAWLQPEKIAQWMLGPTGGKDEMLHVEVDARVGGFFSFLVLRQGQKIDHLGKYLEVDRPRRLVFTFDAVMLPEGQPSPNPSIVHLDFVPDGSGTLLTLTHERVPQEFAEPTRAGWTKIVEAVAKLLEGTL